MSTHFANKLNIYVVRAHLVRAAVELRRNASFVAARGRVI